MTERSEVAESWLVQVGSKRPAGDVEMEEVAIPVLRRASSLKRPKDLRQQIEEAVAEVAPDINTAPIVEAVTNLARERGWK